MAATIHIIASVATVSEGICRGVEITKSRLSTVSTTISQPEHKKLIKTEHVNE